MALGGQSGVANARKTAAELAFELALACIERPVAVRVIDHIIEILQALLTHEVAQDIHVAVRLRIGGENVVIGNDDNLLAVPHFGVGAELALEHADGARAAHVMGHENVYVHPDIIAGLHRFLARRAGHDFFCKCHYYLNSKAAQDTRSAACAQSADLGAGAEESNRSCFPAERWIYWRCLGTLCACQEAELPQNKGVGRHHLRCLPDGSSRLAESLFLRR